jgi:hypothetical protein
MEILSRCPRVVNLPVRLNCVDLPASDSNLGLSPSLAELTANGHPYGPTLHVRFPDRHAVDPLSSLLRKFLPHDTGVQGGLYHYETSLEEPDEEQKRERCDELVALQEQEEWGKAVEHPLL